MKQLLLFAAFLVAGIVSAQDLRKDSVYVFTSLRSDETFYKTYTTYSCSAFDTHKFNNTKDQIIYVSTIFKCNDKYLVSGYYLGSSGYLILSEDSNKKFLVAKDEKPYSLLELYAQFQTLEDNELIKGQAEILSKNNLSFHFENEYNDLMKHSKYPIGILQSYPTDNYSMTGAKFKIVNFSKKTIKYISFNFYGKNAVGDKVQYRKGTFIATRKGIGPIETYESGTYSFEDVWLTDIVQKLHLNSVVIQYMDNTTKTTVINDFMYMDEDVFDNFNVMSEEINNLK